MPVIFHPAITSIWRPGTPSIWSIPKKSGANCRTSTAISASQPPKQRSNACSIWSITVMGTGWRYRRKAPRSCYLTRTRYGWSWTVCAASRRISLVYWSWTRPASSNRYTVWAARLPRLSVRSSRWRAYVRSKSIPCFSPGVPAVCAVYASKSAPWCRMRAA